MLLMVETEISEGLCHSNNMKEHYKKRIIVSNLLGHE